MCEVWVYKLNINVQHTMDADMVRLNSLIRERILYDVDIAQVNINPDNEVSSRIAIILSSFFKSFGKFIVVLLTSDILYRFIY